MAAHTPKTPLREVRWTDDRPDRARTVVDAEGVRHVYYNDWHHFVDRTTGDAPASIPEYQRSSRRRGDAEWAGTSSIEESLELARSGWAEGAAKVNAMRQSYVSRLGSKVHTPVTVYAEEPGWGLDVGAFLSGEPAHWLASEPHVRTGAGNIFKVVFNGACTASVDTDVMIARGCVTAALVELLELGGYAVELELVYGNVPTARASSRSISQYTSHIPLKHAGQTASAATLAYALAHPSTMRRLHFGDMELLPKEVARKHGVGVNYGASATVQQADRGDLYIDRAYGAESTWDNPEQATAWIVAQLRKAGLEVSD